MPGSMALQGGTVHDPRKPMAGVPDWYADRLLEASPDEAAQLERWKQSRDVYTRRGLYAMSPIPIREELRPRDGQPLQAALPVVAGDMMRPMAAADEAADVGGDVTRVAVPSDEVITPAHRAASEVPVEQFNTGSSPTMPPDETMTRLQVRYAQPPAAPETTAPYVRPAPAQQIAQSVGQYDEVPVDVGRGAVDPHARAHETATSIPHGAASTAEDVTRTISANAMPLSRMDRLKSAAALFGEKAAATAAAVAPYAAMAGLASADEQSPAGDLRYMSYQLGLGPLTPEKVGAKYGAYLMANPEVAAQLADEGVLSVSTQQKLALGGGW